MTDASNKKEGFKKCRSATFSIDGYSFTIGENFPPPFYPLSDFCFAQTPFLEARKVLSKLGRGVLRVRRSHEALGEPREGQEVVCVWPGRRAQRCTPGAPPAALPNLAPSR